MWKNIVDSIEMSAYKLLVEYGHIKPEKCKLTNEEFIPIPHVKLELTINDKVYQINPAGLYKRVEDKRGKIHVHDMETTIDVLKTLQRF